MKNNLQKRAETDRSGTQGAEPVADPSLGGETLRQVSADIAREFPLVVDETSVVLMDVDPYRLHVYWSLADGAMARALRAFGGHAGLVRLVLRFREIAEGDGTVQLLVAPRDAFDREVGEEGGRLEVDVWSPGKTYEAELGLTADDGGWLSLARSNRVHMPPPGPADRAPRLAAKRPLAGDGTAGPTVPEPSAVTPVTRESAETQIQAPSQAVPGVQERAAEVAAGPAIPEPSAATPIVRELADPQVQAPSQAVSAMQEPAAEVVAGPAIPEPSAVTPIARELADPQVQAVTQAAPAIQEPAAEEESDAPVDCSLIGGDEPLEPVFPNVAPLEQPAPQPEAGQVVALALPETPPPPTEPAGDLATEPRPETPVELPGSLLSLSSSALSGGEADLELFAELHIYGRTTPGKELRLFGRRVPLNEDGSFDVRQSIPRESLLLPLLMTEPKGTPEGE